MPIRKKLLNRSDIKYFLLLILLPCMSTIGNAQEIPSVKMDDVVKMIDTSKGPLIINFWASWCKPCIQEIPGFEKQVSLAGDKVKLVLVSLDFSEDYPDKLKVFVSAQKYASSILWLSEKDANSFCPKIDNEWEGGIPATLFVNRSKNYRHFVNVPMSEEQFKKELDKTL